MGLHDLGEELHTNCCLLGLVELVANVPGRDVGLARPAAPYYHDLEHLVIIVHFIICYSFCFVLCIDLYCTHHSCISINVPHSYRS